MQQLGVAIPINNPAARIKYAATKKVHFVVENPPTSLIFKVPALKDSERVNSMRTWEISKIASALNLEVTTRYVDSQGRKRVAGGKDLRSTQCYPAGLGLAVTWHWGSRRYGVYLECTLSVLGVYLECT
ncbi:unnamed protein product [Effrenium voratum]|nr:unnamed protein product [Effrenium voratum]